MPDAPMTMSCRGRLLVATPPLGDPNFDRSVVYVLEHNGAGAIGVVLNRPLALECPEPLRQWRGRLSTPPVVFGGGPVDPDALIGVGRVRGASDEQWQLVSRSGAIAVGSIDLSSSPDDVDGEVLDLRLFRGYSGWAPLQLEAELEHRMWMIFDAVDDDLFGAEPDGLWRRVVRRQGGRVAWAADAPDDLSAN